MPEPNAKKSPIELFAISFKSYAIALGILVASVPIASRAFELLPVYRAMESVLTFFTSFASYLGVALVFSMRRKIGNAVFPSGSRVLSRQQMWRRWCWQVLVPACMIAVSVVSLVAYLRIVEHSVTRAAMQQSFVPQASKRTTLEEHLEADDVNAGTAGARSQEAHLFGESGLLLYGSKLLRDPLDPESVRYTVRFASEGDLERVLDTTPSVGIPDRTELEIGYVLMFVSAAMAFVWFGIIEYVQSVMGLEDRELLLEPYRLAADLQFSIDAVRDAGPVPTPVYFELSYNPDDPAAGLVGAASGPYCGQHGVLLQYAGAIPADGKHVWSCMRKIDKQVESHTLTLQHSDLDMQSIRIEAATAQLARLERP